MDGVPLLIFEILVLFFSVIVHEISHGVTAERLGDPTARLAGRITLNPLKHIDPFGSVILPLLLALPALFGQPAFIFGWAKPVPYNPNVLKNPRSGAGQIAAAGPISNILLAIVFGLMVRTIDPASPLSLLFEIIIYINILLAVFNLLPLPPLDGSKVLFALLPATERSSQITRFLERYGFVILLAIIFFGGGILFPIVRTIFGVIAGRSLGF